MSEKYRNMFLMKIVWHFQFFFSIAWIGSTNHNMSITYFSKEAIKNYKFDIPQHSTSKVLWIGYIFMYYISNKIPQNKYLCIFNSQVFLLTPTDTNYGNIGFSELLH